MGDRAYTRFSIPAVNLTPANLSDVAHIFGRPVAELQATMADSPDPIEAGYDNSTVLRLVQGCACLVIEYDSWNQAGSDEEARLQLLGIPYLRLNHAGDQYGASQTVFNGTAAVDVRLDQDDQVVVGVAITPNGVVAVDEEELEEVRRFVAVAKSVLRSRTTSNLPDAMSSILQRAN